MSLRNKLLEVPDVVIESIGQEWGEELFIRTLSGAERAKIQSKTMDCSKTGRWVEANAMCVLLGLCESNGAPIFNEKDYGAVLDKNGTVLERIAAKVIRLNGLGGDSVDDAKKN